MATIDEVISAYYLHRSQGMMNPLNNLHRRYSTKSVITKLMAKDLLEGAHQVRLITAKSYNYGQLFDEVCDRLMRSTLLTASFSTFEDLYNAVDALLIKHKKINGVGKLTVYDIALRIGYIRNEQILPKDKIYLFAGALNGANNLLDVKPSLFDVTKLSNTTKIAEGTYDMNIFHSPLTNMPSMYLEDLLCVYHSKLKKFPYLDYKDFQKVPFYCFLYN